MTTRILAILLSIASVAAAAPVLREARFDPSIGTISLTIVDDGFSRSQSLTLSTLSSEQQTAVGGVLAWLGSQLPAGFQTVQQIILEPGPEVPATYGEVENGDDPPVMITVPVTWRRTLNAAVTGSGPAGERTITIPGGAAPVDASTALLAIWDALETSQATP